MIQTLEQWIEVANAWCEERLLRGTERLSLTDIQQLEHLQELARQWQMSFAEQRLQALIVQVRLAALGDQTAPLHVEMAQFAQYTVLLEQQGSDNP